MTSFLDYAPLRIVVSATGAGAGLQDALWGEPGVSSILVESNFPYSRDAIERFLGFQPASYCSAKTAVEMAMASYIRAFDPTGPKAIGIGLTASVTTNREHKGDHRVFASWFSDHGCEVTSRVLPKNLERWSRSDDGKIADLLGLDTISRALGMDTTADYLDASLLAKEAFWEHPVFTKDGLRPAIASPEAIFPGAFNPPHEGHFGIAKAFRGMSGKIPFFQITADPPHKDALKTYELLQRASLLRGYDVVFTEGDALYVDKARSFPGIPMILGVDAFERMLDLKWGVAVDHLVREFQRLGTELYVVKTRNMGGERLDVSRVSLPNGMKVNFIDSQWDDFSSTAVREGR